MGALRRAAALGALLCGCSAFDPVSTVNLTAADFDERVFGEKQTWLLMFWAPWCPHCRRVKPFFAEASRDAPPGTRLGLVDCTADEAKPVCTEHGVASYPSLRYSIQGSELIPYDGGRDQHSFQVLLKRLAAGPQIITPISEPPKSREDLIQVAFCTADGKPNEAAKWIAFRAIGYLRCIFLSLPFAAADCGGEARLLLYNDAGTMRYTPEGDKVNWDVGLGEGPEDSGQLPALVWVKDNRHLVVDMIDQTNFHHIVGKAKRPFVCMYVAPSGDMKSARPVLTVLRAIAKTPEGSGYSFGWIDGALFREWVVDFIAPEELPALLLYSPSDQTYVLSGPEMRAMLRDGIMSATTPGADPVRWKARAAELEAAVRQWLSAVADGDELPSYQGTAGYLFHALRAVGLGLVNKPLVSLRKQLDSDVLFMGIMLLGFTVFTTTVTSIAQACCGAGGDEPSGEEALRQARQSAASRMRAMQQQQQQQQQQRAAPQGGQYECSAATPPASPQRQRDGPTQRAAARGPDPAGMD